MVYIGTSRPKTVMVFMKYYDSFLGRAQYIERDLIIPSNTSLEEVEKMVKKEYPNYFFFNWKGLVVKRVPSEQKK